MNFVTDPPTEIPKLARLVAPAVEQAAKDGTEMVVSVLTEILFHHTLLVNIESIDRCSWEVDNAATLDEARERLRACWAEYTAVACLRQLAGAESASPKETSPLEEGPAAPAPTPLQPAPEAPTLTHSPRAINPGGYF